MYREGDTQIGTLRVRARGDDPNRPALQRRVSYLLNTVDFRVPGASPPGILMVRHLDDPLPGKLAPHDQAVKASLAWEQALKSSLQEKYRNASRPVRGYIAPDAAAVFFEDEGEMLAALALDISRGQARGHWWWNVILRNLQFSPETDMKTFLGREITLLPAILHHLAEWRIAAEVLDKLSADQALTLLRALNQTFHLDLLPVPVFHPPPGPVETPPPNGTWRQWLANYGRQDHLTAEQAALLGVGLTLFQGPAKVRTTSFKQRFHEWWAHEQWKKQPARPMPSPGFSTPDHGQAPTSSTSQKPTAHLGEHEINSPRKKETTPSPISPAAPWESSDLSREKEKQEPHPGRKTENSSPAPTAPAKVSPVSTESPVLPLPGPLVPYKDEGKRTWETGPLPRKKQATAALATIRFEDATAAQPGASARREWAETGVETRLGGVFYLINLVERLDIPARIHESRGQDGEIGPWAILEILARALLGDRCPDLETDPLWRVLGELDGREPGILPESLYPHVTLWIEHELPAVRSFLYNVLGPPTIENPEPGKTMLLYSARVYITSTHVDIVMSLEDISLPARMAGLDRDPGWQPEYARIILFHFI